MRLRATAADPELRAALEALYQKERRFIELHPGATEATLEALGHPERAYPCVQIAGTNGKGSVAAMVAAAAAGGSNRVGLFTSPHLVDWRERLRIGTDLPSEADALRVIREAVAGAERAGVKLTFFEVTTVAAVLWFARSQVSLGVFEVGLGGRLDATSAVAPCCTAVVTIGLDHTRLLGDDVNTIAGEKGAIARAGVPMVCGALEPGPLAVVKRICAERGAPVSVLGEDFGYDVSAGGDPHLHYRGPGWELNDVKVPLAGPHQMNNAAVALRVVEALGGGAGDLPEGVRPTPTTAAAGLGDTFWPGRYEVLRRPGGGRLILDVAHNAQGAAALSAALAQQETAPVQLIYGGMGDKRHEAILETLAPHVAAVAFTRSQHKRSAEPADLVALARRKWPHLDAVAGEEDAASVALTVAKRAPPSRPVLVSGSIYLMGEVRDALLAWCREGE